MSVEDRVRMNRRIAEGYRNAYMRLEVQEGEKYDSWNFAPDAEYVSPYWTGDEIWMINDLPTDAQECAMMEAQAISMVYPDWKPTDCRIWTGDDGFVMKNHWRGEKADGTVMCYYSYTFARTNEAGQISRWETHVNEDFGPFIASVLGEPGPWRRQEDYVALLHKALEKPPVTT